MMLKAFFSAALVMVSALSLAPQALVCGSVQKHECSCCGGGDACTCCDIAPFYPDEAATPVEAVRVSAPVAWTPLAADVVRPDGGPSAVPIAVECAHGPPPLSKNSQLRI